MSNSRKGIIAKISNWIRTKKDPTSGDMPEAPRSYEEYLKTVQLSNIRVTAAVKITPKEFKRNDGPEEAGCLILA